MQTNEREFKVFKIKNGTVIDHIPAAQALKVIEIIGHKTDGLIAIGMNLDSNKMGKKDLIKYENKFLEKKETDKLALIAPGATINIIKDSKVIEKRKINLPEVLENIIRCPNPNCISTVENLETRFILENEKEKNFKCFYCERVFNVSADMIK
ncbi:MAG: aspartate carbamoyltransferase regulatory subunit [Spirochaetes bacterium]|nr:aspartate carbamoyltransferase regulatory subunit [Spirochaetota bacterium]